MLIPYSILVKSPGPFEPITVAASRCESSAQNHNLEVWSTVKSHTYHFKLH